MWQPEGRKIEMRWVTMTRVVDSDGDASDVRNLRCDRSEPWPATHLPQDVIYLPRHIHGPSPTDNGSRPLTTTRRPWPIAHRSRQPPTDYGASPTDYSPLSTDHDSRSLTTVPRPPTMPHGPPIRAHHRTTTGCRPPTIRLHDVYSSVSGSVLSRPHICTVFVLDAGCYHANVFP
jgi:hypothetical protein